ncbi:hypothetical protein TUM4641_33780 [Shewanella morhuae]|nr:hypothetical protein TUM4641_33780 [Shewanella morhuae]
MWDQYVTRYVPIPLFVPKRSDRYSGKGNPFEPQKPHVMRVKPKHSKLLAHAYPEALSLAF